MWDCLHPEAKPFAGEHIASWIGSAVHARLAGEELPAMPEPALFDDRTPTARHAKAQINMVVKAIEATVDPVGWKVLAREMPVRALIEGAVITGTCDFVVDTGLGKAVLDVKTGHAAYHSWLQLGAYAAALEAEGEGPASVGLIACPRPRVGRPEAAHIEFRPSGPAKADAGAVIRRVSALFNDGSEPLPNPGVHCARCRVSDCASRVLPRQKEGTTCQVNPKNNFKHADKQLSAPRSTPSRTLSESTSVPTISHGWRSTPC